MFSCNTTSYELPSTKMNRFTTLGKGHRFGDLINKSEAPSPESYNILSKDFSDKKRGIIFGVSRDRYTKVSD